VNDQRAQLGLIYGISAYVLWGLIPMYFKAVQQVPAVEVLAHRAIWSFLVLSLLLACFQRWPEFIEELRNRKLRLMLALSSLCIGINWVTFIYAVTSGQILQTSLGYFITPLVSVSLGVAVFRERLRAMQLFSVLLGMSGMLIFACYAGRWPWIAVTLATSFGLYGFFRKIMPVDGLLSLTAETFLMSPIAIVYLAWRHAAGQGAFHDLHYVPYRGIGLMVLLMLSGPVSISPLLLFAASTRRLRLATIGILQYLAPSISFVLAVFYYHEPFKLVQTVSFIIIWTAVAIYTADSLWAAHQNRLAVVEPFGGEDLAV
jgi:chloramphenicol-sensitive protein RarD